MREYNPMPSQFFKHHADQLADTHPSNQFVQAKNQWFREEKRQKYKKKTEQLLIPGSLWVNYRERRKKIDGTFRRTYSRRDDRIADR
jgi:hypothetical protein